MIMTRSKVNKILRYTGMTLGIAGVGWIGFLAIWAFISTSGGLWWFMPPFVISLSGLYYAWKQRLSGVVLLLLGSVMSTLIFFFWSSLEGSFLRFEDFALSFLIFGLPLALSAILLWVANSNRGEVPHA